MPEKNMVKHSNLVDSYNRNSIMDDIDSLQIQHKYYQTEKFSKKQVCYAGKNGKKWKQFCELHEFIVAIITLKLVWRCIYPRTFNK